MKKLRILTISHMFPRAGMKRYGIFLCREAAYLRKHDIECSFLVSTPLAPWPIRCLPRWRRYGAEWSLDGPADLDVRHGKYFRPPGEWFSRFEGLSMYAALAGITRRWHHETPFDLVFACPMLPDADVGRRVARRLNLPLVTMSIGSDVLVYPRRRPVLEKTLRTILAQSDLPVGVCEAICNRIRDIGPSRRDPLCVYLGRDSGMFSPPADKGSLRSELGWGSDEIVAIYVGWISRTKGIGELVTAFESLLPGHPRLKLVCLGDGPAMELLQGLKQRLARDNAVSLPGLIAPEEVVKYLQASDFMVFPSHSEGMPQAVLEAGNCGIPAVATRVGGIPEAIEDGVSGLLVDPKSPDQLATAVDRMISDGEFRSRASRAILQTVRTKFDSEANARRFADALWALAGRNGATTTKRQ